MLFEVPERPQSARYPVHLRPKGDGYALIVDTPNGARTNLLAPGSDWSTALERFLAEQERTGLRGAITSATDAELTDVRVYDSCAYPHLESDAPAAYIELSQDLSQRSLFPDLTPSPYRLMLTTHEGSIDLLVERSRPSYLEAYAFLHAAHDATGLPAFVTSPGGRRVRAMTAKSVPHPSRQY